mmetsp:Transcript_17368/g.43217  ORF Transcript_17368/g.43217 Transcript_17368/m.43217 type:complete len:209 (-) Transcript_17368:130-756(-)
MASVCRSCALLFTPGCLGRHRRGKNGEPLLQRAQLGLVVRAQQLHLDLFLVFLHLELEAEKVQLFLLRRQLAFQLPHAVANTRQTSSATHVLKIFRGLVIPIGRVVELGALELVKVDQIPHRGPRGQHRRSPSVRRRVEKVLVRSFQHTSCAPRSCGGCGRRRHRGGRCGVLMREGRFGGGMEVTPSGCGVHGVGAAVCVGGQRCRGG